MMKIKWLGHSCFLLTAGDGAKLLMDPFKAETHLSYKQVDEKADMVTVSHDHFDHNYTAALPGNPEVVKGGIEKAVKGIKVKGISVFHDESGGEQRGSNTVYCAAIDDISVCHLGDLGHRLSPAQLAAVGKVDVLLVPVGGVFTIDVETANQVCDDIKPRIAIPMHYKTDRCQFLQWGAEDFASGKKTVKRLAGSEFEITKNSRPAEFEIVVLQYPA
jgi:L-ascorbate metabolism protein UlaG (beta-lactamase superfamily)